MIRKKLGSLNVKKTGFPLMLLAWVFILFCLNPWDNLKSYVIKRQGAEESRTQVYGSVSAEQSFIVDGIFDCVDIGIYNYNHTFEGNFTARIYDESGGCIYEKVIDKTELGDEWLTLKLGREIIAENKSYRVEITAPKLDRGHCVEVCHSDKRTYGDGVMKLYGWPRDKTMCFSVYDSRGNIFALLAIGIFLAAAGAWWVNREKSIFRVSAIILFGMGMCMLVMMAPFCAPDERYHYYSSLALSNVVLGQEDIYESPEEYLDFPEVLDHYNYNQSFMMAMQQFFSRDNGIKEDIASFQYARMDMLRHPATHLAPALGITLGRMLGMNLVGVFYLGRFFNLVLYAVLVMVAIKIMPKNKELMLLVASYPMCLHQAAALSYDIIINGMSFVIVAYVMKLSYQNQKITWKDISVLIVVGWIMCPDKLVYYALMLLVLMLPKERFQKPGNRIPVFAVILGSVLLLVFIIQFPVFKEKLFEAGQAVSAANHYNMQFIMQHPWKFAQLICNTWFWQSVDWIELGIGSNLAGYTLPVPAYLVWGFVILTAICCFQKGQGKWNFSISQKMVLGLSVAAGIILVIVGAADWSDYGGKTVSFIQGRYFIPFMMPLLLVVQNDKIVADIESKKIFYAYWFLQAGVVNTVLSSVAF